MSSTSQTQHLEALPKAHTTYTNVVKSLLPALPIINKKKKTSKNSLPDVTYNVDRLKINKENLADYRRICGFANDGQVPVTYFSVLSQSLQMNMMANEAFPFAMLGLVHIDNSVTQYRPIADNEIVSMSVDFDNLRDHDKGKQFDFVTHVLVGNDLVWQGTSTYLSRGRSKSSDGKKSSNKASTEKLTATENSTHAVFEVPEDIGRRYAKISGDFNLIHLHPLTAKAFGFRKAIAHGMWSKAKSLSQLDLPDAYKVSVAFKLPIYLPSEVELIAEDTSVLFNDNSTDKASVAFGLYDAKDDKPHLSGTITSVVK